jgi:hypothetical protein
MVAASGDRHAEKLARYIPHRYYRRIVPENLNVIRDLTVLDRSGDGVGTLADGSPAGAATASGTGSHSDFDVRGLGQVARALSGLHAQIFNLDRSRCLRSARLETAAPASRPPIHRGRIHGFDVRRELIGSASHSLRSCANRYSLPHAPLKQTREHDRQLKPCSRRIRHDDCLVLDSKDGIARRIELLDDLLFDQNFDEFIFDRF